MSVDVIALERILCPIDFSDFSARAAAQAGGSQSGMARG
jgi:hypothetical protein